MSGAIKFPYGGLVILIIFSILVSCTDRVEPGEVILPDRGFGEFQHFDGKVPDGLSFDGVYWRYSPDEKAKGFWFVAAYRYWPDGTCILKSSYVQNEYENDPTVQVLDMNSLDHAIAGRYKVADRNGFSVRLYTLPPIGWRFLDKDLEIDKQLNMSVINRDNLRGWGEQPDGTKYIFQNITWDNPIKTHW